MRIRLILIAVLTMGLAAACGGKKTGGTGPDNAGGGEGGSLYDRLGKKDAIQAVVHEFIGIVVADDRINKFFAKADATNLEKQLTDQICKASGGPCEYTGKDMKTAHTGMQISDADFNALVEDLGKALDKFNVGQKEKDELVGALGPLKGDIVGQ
jgi:hemoglobin